MLQLDVAQHIHNLSEAHTDSIHVTGAAIFHHSKLLHVRGAGPEKENTLPNHWELPGGGVEAGESVEEGVRREVFEETGLVITKILELFEPMSWTSHGRLNIQFNVLATVDDKGHAPVVKLNPDEHSEFMWVASLADFTEQAGEEALMTEQMHEVVENALRCYERQR